MPTEVVVAETFTGLFLCGVVLVGLSTLYAFAMDFIHRKAFESLEERLDNS